MCSPLWKSLTLIFLLSQRLCVKFYRLAYKDIDDCVAKLQYWREYSRTPELERRVLRGTATDRLYEQSSITVRDAGESRDSGMDEYEGAAPPRQCKAVFCRAVSSAASTLQRVQKLDF
jgi:hypothetical protein